MHIINKENKHFNKGTLIIFYGQAIPTGVILTWRKEKNKIKFEVIFLFLLEQVFITQGILDLDSIDNCLQKWNK